MLLLRKRAKQGKNDYEVILLKDLTKKLIISSVVSIVLGFGIYSLTSQPVDIDSPERQKAVEAVAENKVPEVPVVSVKDEGKNQKILGRAFAVYDGDTCRIEIPGGKYESLRFAHIDAPEKNQESGLEAQKFLANMIDGREITAYILNTDKYGRKVVDVYYDGRYINAEMVKNGYAWHYKAFDKEGTDVYKQLDKYEQEARKNKLGLWKNEKPEAPWGYRKRSK